MVVSTETPRIETKVLAAHVVPDDLTSIVDHRLGGLPCGRYSARLPAN